MPIGIEMASVNGIVRLQILGSLKIEVTPDSFGDFATKGQDVARAAKEGRSVTVTATLIHPHEIQPQRGGG